MASRRSIILGANSLKSATTLLSTIPRHTRLRLAPLAVIGHDQFIRRFVASPKTWAKVQDQPEIDRTRSKLWKDADEAVADLKSGSVILSAGFGLCGTAGKSSFNRCQQIVTDETRNYHHSNT